MAEVTGLRNNALPYPVYGAPWGVVYPMLDADGDLVTGATTPDAERSLNGDTFADCTNESTEIATASGVYYLLLTAAEMTADVVSVIAKSATAGMKTTVLTFYPAKLPVLRANTVGANAADGTTIQLDSGASAVDDFYTGCLIVGTLDAVVEARVIADYVGSTKVCTITPAFITVPDNNDTFVVYQPWGRQVGESHVNAIAASAITATSIATDAITAAKVADGTIDAATFAASAITATSIATGAITAAKFAAGAIDAAAVADGAIDAATFAAGAITATVVADGTIDAATFAANAITSTVIANDAITDAKVASDVTIASVTGAVGSVTGAVGSVTGAVGSIATGGIAAASFAAGAIDATAIAANAIGASELAADAVAEIADGVWDEVTSGHVTVGTFGQRSYIIRASTAQAGASTTITLDASASSVDDFYNSTIIVLTGGTGAGQARFISDYVGATKVATVPAWATNPDNTSVFVIMPFGAIPGATAPTAAEVADAVWDEDATGHQNGGTFGQAIGDPGADATTIYQSIVTDAAGTNVAADIIAVKAETALIQTDTNDIQTRLPAALVSGRIDSSVGAVAANTITAAAIADSAIDRATFAADTGLQTIRSNTAQTGAATTITLDTGASAVDSFYNNNLIFLTGGTGVGQSRFISAYVGATKVATVATWATNPDATTTFAILPFDAVAGATAPTVGQIADAVWDEDATAHQTGGTFGQAIGDPGADTTTIYQSVVTDAAGTNVAIDVIAVKADTASIQTDTNDIQTRLPAALVSGRIDASVGAMAANTITATAIAADAITAAKVADGTIDAATFAANAITSTVIANDAITDAKVAADVTIASVTGAVGSVTGAVGSVTGNVGGNVTGSVGSVATGGIAAASFAAGAIDATAIAANAIGASELAADAVTEIADGILARDIGSGTNAGTLDERTVRSALRFLRNKWSITGTALTVTTENDTTTAWTSTLTATAGVDPITATDPA